jgi:hypothetical protein
MARKPFGRATLGDALSNLQREKLDNLRNQLQQQANVAWTRQIGQPKPPWRKEFRKIRGPRKGQLVKYSGKNKYAPTHGQQKPDPGAKRRRREAERPKGPIRPPDPRPYLFETEEEKQRKKIRVRPERNRPKPFQFWTLPSIARVREAAPNAVAESDVRLYEKLLVAGTRADGDPLGDILFAVIGIDFGTSSTKIVVRFPYEPGEPAIAIPAPRHCLAEDNPYLWATFLWCKEGAEFQAYPSSGSRELATIKQAICSGSLDPEKLEPSPSEVATAYLGNVIRYAKGWLLENEPGRFRNRRLRWHANIGLPAANFDDERLLSTYRKVGCAAYLLASSSSDFSRDAIRTYLGLEGVVGSAVSADAAEELGVSIIPETTAEVVGFVKSTGRAPGVYVLADVGAMTLDVCGFRLNNADEGDGRLSLFSAQVQPLGVESYHWFRANENRTDAAFRDQVDRCIREVVWDVKRNKDPRAECWAAGAYLPLFLAGGGSRNSLHQGVVGKISEWIRQHTHNEGVRPITLPRPRNLDLPIDADPMHANSMDRMTVALGLSYPPTEIPRTTLPSEIDDIPPMLPIDTTGRFVSKDMV